MKITIRHGVFETNSSSVHAIAIPKAPLKADWRNGFAPTVYFEHGEFGWEHSILYTTDSKASYLFQALTDAYCPYKIPSKPKTKDEDEFKKYKNANREYKEQIRKFNNIKNWIFKTLMNYGIEPVFNDQDFDEAGWVRGYIDHGNALNSFTDYIIGNEKHLLQYLFGDTQICTSNDNYGMEDIDTFIADHPQKHYEIFVKGN